MRSMRRATGHLGVGALVLIVLLTGLRHQATAEGDQLSWTQPAQPVPVRAVESVGLTVSNMERAVEFYTSVLSFEQVAETEADGRAVELLYGVFGARVRVVRLQLGDEILELTEFLAPKGRPIPDDMRPNDRAFQHVAVIVSDMARAYERLRAHGVQHASSGPQELPDWNPNAGGIRAFYFRDPDGHFLEILQFPPGKGAEKWQAKDRLFLGIDHTAIVVEDTDRSLELYRGLFEMQVAGESENFETEQEHLNGVFGARLRITALRSPAGPGIELLEYLAPRDGRPAPRDLKANDVLHWQTTLVTSQLARVIGAARLRLFDLVSPMAVRVDHTGLGVREGALIRDRDGHGLRLVSATPQRN